MIANLQPYPEYKESGLSWLGAIPRHWNGGPGFAAFREKQVKNTGMQEKTVLSLSYGRIVVKPPEKLHGLVPDSFETYQIVDPGDIIIRSTDLQNDWNSLRVGLVRNRGIITSAYLCFRTTGTLSPEYGYQLLHSFDLMKVFYGLGSGLRQNLDWSDFKRMLIFIPPPEEQAAIVRFLNYANGRLERAILAKRKVIALLHEQKQAIIHRAVTRGLDPAVPLKPCGIPWLGDIPTHWEVLPLKAVSEIQGGITLGKDYAGQATRAYPYLRVANVQSGHANLAVVKTIRVTKADAERCLLQKGDVLMTEGGDPDKLGRGCVWDAQVAPCLHQNHVFAVRPNQLRLEPQFLSALMGTSYARAYFQSTAKQTTNLAATNKTKIGMFKVLLPKVDEQNRILTALNEETRPVNTAIARLEREIALLREYRTRLVADVVTGKLDVRPVARQLPAEPVEQEPAPAPEEVTELEEAIPD
jgi:type I restriction enzyme, S subunit